MRHILGRALSAAFLLAGAGLAFGSSLGPVATRTGAPSFGGRPAEQNCTACHNQIPTVNSPTGSMRILGVPLHYTPGQVYPITITLQHTRPIPSANPLHWGFQMQACKASNGDSAGTWVLGTNAAPDTFKLLATSVTTGQWRRRQYIEHARRNDPNQPTMGAIRHGFTSPVTWTVNWKAPLTDVCVIYFFAAGNAANGDWENGQFLAYSDTGDYIFTTAESTLAPVQVDVPPGQIGALDFLGEPYPNPAGRSTSLSFTIVRGGLLDIAVFDVNGRLVKTLMHDFRDPGSGTVTWDGTSAAGARTRDGLYFIRMFAPGEKRTLVRKVTLTR